MFEQRFEEIQGILTIFAGNPMWPSPANLFVIPDDQGFSLIDVGCGGLSGPEHLLGGLAHWGLNLKDLHTVVLTHAHPDHMGAMDWVCEEARPRVLLHHLEVGSALEPEKLVETFDVPLANECWASSEYSRSYEGFDLLGYFDQLGCPMTAAEEVEGVLEGDILHLGDFAFEVVHTPGHSPGHMSLFETNTGVLLPGDIVGPSPTWYTPTSGGVIGYLNGLAKLEGLDARILLPSHGAIIVEPVQAIRMIRDKLMERDALLRDALSDGPKRFLELNEALFPGPFARFFPGCAIIESHLIKLETDGAIEREEQRIILIQSG